MTRAWMAGLWLGLIVPCLCLAADLPNFVDDNHADFVGGTLDDGGHNLYAAKDGSLRTINRFDLNSDGHLDLLFNCTHNTYQMLPATAGTIGANRQASTVDVAVEGSQRSVVFDLNHDGYSDIVFCPNPIGVHHNRRFVFVAWGGAEGWSSRRINSPLPIDSAATVDVADLNGDGWEDIAVLGGARWRPEQPTGRIVRLFWGSPTGFSVTEFHDLGVAAALDLAAGDFDGDAARDLAVLRSDGKVTLFWSHASKDQPWSPQSTELGLSMADSSCVVAGDVTADGKPDLVIGSSAAAITVVKSTGARQFADAIRSTAFPSTQVTIADFDHDGQTDLALAQFDQARAHGGEQAGAGKNAKDNIRILWGGPAGFANDRLTNLEIPLAVASAAGDLDGDGHVDLAVAVHQG